MKYKLALIEKYELQLNNNMKNTNIIELIIKVVGIKTGDNFCPI